MGSMIVVSALRQPHILPLTYVYSCVNMPRGVIESLRGGAMDHDEAIRRSIPFLQELERKLGLPVTSAAPSSPSLNARQNKLPKNPQETHGAPPPLHKAITFAAETFSLRVMSFVSRTQ